MTWQVKYTVKLIRSSLQIYAPQNFDKIHETDFETIVQHKLSQLPLTIAINSKNYQLSAAILFQPPTTPGIGHYTAVVKFNKKWTVYDDLRGTVIDIPSELPVVLHSILYTVYEKNN